MKRLILVLALVLPIGIFIFLRYFGKNEFTIPVYYEQGVEINQSDCNRNYSVPYIVADSVLRKIGWQNKPLLIVTDSLQINSSAFVRLIDEFKQKVEIKLPGNGNEFQSIYLCDLLMQAPWTVVLIDEQRRIRGYYAPNSREEIDRLKTEMDILLKNY
jgi:hypothetical protein